MKNNKLYIFAFLAIVVLCAFLRVYKVVEVPPGLYVDEVAIGVNADAILHTGKDEWGFTYPMWFKSFGDYKMPLYIYATSLSMAIVGKSELAIRLPSILAGIGTVILVFFLVKDLILLDREEKDRKKFHLLPILCMLAISITPWHIQFSRGGFEVNLALFFYCLATWFVVRFFLLKKDYFIVMSMVGYVASIYTYHSFRIITPLTIILILSIFILRRVLFTKKIIAAFTLFFILCIPVFLFSFSAEGSARFSQTSTFSEYPVNSFIEKVSLYPLVFIKNYLSFFSLDFLFSFGDGNGRHQIPNFGILGRWQLVFIIVGLFSLLKKRKSAFSLVIFALFFLAPLPGAITRPSPHSLRSLLLVIPYTLLTGYGLYSIITTDKKVNKLLIMGSFIFILYDFFFYWHFYMSHYPQVNLLDWGAGNKEMVLKTKKLSASYDKVIVDSNFSNIAIYYKFYNDGTVPEVVSNDWKKTPDLEKKKILYVRPNYAQVDKTNRVDVVYLPNVNNDVYAEFWEVK